MRLIVAKRWRTAFACWLAIVLPGALADSRPGALLILKRTDFCVTEGSLGDGYANSISVNVPKMRAYVTVPTSPSAEIGFHYLGATARKSALGSGQVRSQFGLKLRAQDPCNLVYVMWRIEPESKLMVSVKRNPGQHTSAECGNRGYVNVKARTEAPVPRLKVGDAYALRAEMKNSELRIYVDQKKVWEGDLGAEAAGLEGPVGIRSDNVHLEFIYHARRAVGTAADHQVTCKMGESD